MTARFLLSLLLLLSNASTFVSAFAYLTESKCIDMDFSDNGGGGDDIRELCFAIQVIGPSPSVTTLPNGTDVTEYVGESSETYIFEGDLEGLATEIIWDEAVSEVDCVATATTADDDGKLECSSCALCAEGTSVAADCTNLEQGEC